MKERKSAKQLERHFKGVASHWRIRILRAIANDASITLEEICKKLDGNVKTISEHTRKLVVSGLIDKEYKGRSVAHSLSPYGKTFYGFIQSL